MTINFPHMSYDSSVYILASFLIVRRLLNSWLPKPSYHDVYCEVKQNFKLQSIDIKKEFLVACSEYNQLHYAIHNVAIKGWVCTM